MPVKNILRTFASRSSSNDGVLPAGSPGSEMLLAQELFVKQLALERARTERSGRRFVLMLLDPSRLARNGATGPVLERIASALAHSIRETDIRGWYAESVIGVIFTEIDTPDGTDVAKVLMARITAVLCRELRIENHAVDITVRIHPEDWEDGGRLPNRPVRMRDLTEVRSVSRALQTPVDVSGGTSRAVRHAGSEAGGNEHSPFLR